ncbi:chemotaxis protein CheA [Thermosediminibacter oceani]|uniref:Chemotaxis protein CheA n=1 Tax=Thermosediminibacter oceani (strain ATCC BAA-1034 / DSM 16646 / JW/IW-1228P) TaxID=555079 RepID=D9S3A5_THEOJ|nr:chemotaxis protein CheA [Thermosediminibacter oceani]ADL07882.1 CheA signal transduction histidine kinase [Thermosediminibacter oceani DSM 16646]
MDNRYLNVFLEEANEHIQNLNNGLLALESEPSQEILDEIFRSAHTLKGMAGTMGFNKISELTHEMEDLLHEIRNGSLSITNTIIDVLLKCVDMLQEMTEQISKEGWEGETDIRPAIAEIKKVMSNTSNDSKAADESEGKDDTGFNEFELRLMEEAANKNLKTWELHVELEENCLLKSARAFLVFKTLENLGEIIKTKPHIQDIEDEKFDKEFYIYIISSRSEEDLLNAVNSVSELKSVNVREINLGNFQKKLTVARETSSVKESPKETNRIRNTSKTLRVDIERLDNLMNLVSELIIIKTRLEELDNLTEQGQKRKEALEYLERITSNLHDAVMKVRMVPIENVFNRFPRVVRDLSRELNKEVKLVIEGAETELDRTVIDEIGDPLIHLIRNALDHGIETPSERLKKGKPREGTLKLKAFHDGNNVVIEVSDDGRGIDVEKVLKKAQEKNMVDKSQVKKLKEIEILSFLFESGFSTSERVTDISGRGVGLDVVKTKIESLGGSVEIKTAKDEGTTFSIRLPLTLAIIQALMVQLGQEKYAIPLSAIKEIVIIPNTELKKVHKHEVILLRGNVIPVLRLHEMLDIPDNCLKNENLTVVIVKKGEKDVGLIVDSLLGEQEIVIKSLGNFLKNIRFIAGATILGDGQVALILDINALI